MLFFEEVSTFLYLSPQTNFYNFIGNIDIQMRMLNHLKDKKDVGFFTSIAGLMNSCSVLDLDAFERNTKAEGN